MANKGNIPGGLTETRMADDETKKICNKVVQDAQVKTARNYVNFEAIAYRSQVVAGINYFIKVNVGGSDYIHLVVFEQLPCHGGEYILQGVQQGKTLDDPIEDFLTN
ncbi:Cystatin-A5 [Merluccius polli]|uniref:Cystatin-B n=1 Tax=Merluccius polli TaxID=89951 RepID=A0AA47MVC9_MERPO|nr:Cystatin-A5 [Merluccius polli]